MRRWWCWSPIVLGVSFLIFAADSEGTEETPPPDRRSGLEFVSPETRSLQADDAANPGMLWILEGDSLWREPAGAARTACADCHGEASESMRGVAARYPA